MLRLSPAMAAQSYLYAMVPDQRAARLAPIAESLRSGSYRPVVGKDELYDPSVRIEVGALKQLTPLFEEETRQVFDARLDELDKLPSRADHNRLEREYEARGVDLKGCRDGIDQLQKRLAASNKKIDDLRKQTAAADRANENFHDVADSVLSAEQNRTILSDENEKFESAEDIRTASLGNLLDELDAINPNDEAEKTLEEVQELRNTALGTVDALQRSAAIESNETIHDGLEKEIENWQGGTRSADEVIDEIRTATFATSLQRKSDILNAWAALLTKKGKEEAGLEDVPNAVDDYFKGAPNLDVEPPVWPAATLKTTAALTSSWKILREGQYFSDRENALKDDARVLHVAKIETDRRGKKTNRIFTISLKDMLAVHGQIAKTFYDSREQLHDSPPPKHFKRATLNSGVTNLFRIEIVLERLVGGIDTFETHEILRKAVDPEDADHLFKPSYWTGLLDFGALLGLDRGTFVLLKEIDEWTS